MIRFYIILLLTIIISACSPSGSGEHEITMYYNDTLLIRDYFPEKASNLKSSNRNIIISDSLIYFRSPMELNPGDLKINIIYNANNQELTKTLNIVCWKNSKYALNEIDKEIPFVFKLKRYFYNKFTNVNIEKKYYTPILLTNNNQTYFVNDGILWQMDSLGNKKYLSRIEIKDPMYNQLIVSGNFGALRTGPDIFFSDDSLKTWEKIYSGPRQIKQSMYWNTEDSSLIFSQYTPGKERIRHYILKYVYPLDRTDTIQTFYTQEEYLKYNLYPCARHIHVLTVDPFTGWIFVGTGDTDLESAIYISKDQGQTFEALGGGSQVWRTLSFIFTPTHILWNTDSDAPQYLSSISRNNLTHLPIDEDNIQRYPLFNSALWCTVVSNDFVIMSSNREGALVDDKRHVFGIKVNESGEPLIYDLFSEHADTWSSQLFPIGVSSDGIIQFYDNQNQLYRYFRIAEYDN